MPQTLAGSVDVATLEGAKQTLALGPVASQEAIKILGTNGGGFFNANSAHPFENTTALTNFVQMLSIFLIGFGLAWLRTEVAKSRKQRRTAKQMHADLLVLGYDGSYNRVAASVRAWKAERQREAQTSGRGTFVPPVFTAGEAFQFDGSEDWAMLAGRQTTLQVAHTKLSHSRAFAVRAYPLQTQEMLFDALTQAFRVLGGVPRCGIFDNMRTAVDRIGAGKA